MTSGRSRGAFARLLRGHRRAAALTQRRLAERAGVGERTVSDLERGVAATPYDDTVRRLAGTLQLSPADTSALRAAARSGAASTGSAVRRLLDAGAARPLVARAVELGRLVETAHVVDGGAGRLVLIAGEAGVGKTRLVLEGCRYVLDRGGQVAIGRCFDTRRGEPFGPVAEALTALAAGLPPDARATLPTRWPHLARLLPELAEDAAPGPPVEGPVDGPAEVAGLQRAVTGLVRTAAAQGPVLLVLEDLHWADLSSLDLLADLVRRTRAEPVLILGTYRDVELGRRHPLRSLLRQLAREETVVRMGLANLAAADTTELVRDRWGGEPPPDLAAAVHRRTDGNPFFVVETVADLRERAGADPVDDLARLGPPLSVSEAVLGRLARLDPSARELLDLACVLGPGLVDDLLLLGADVTTPEEALDRVEESGALRVVDDRFGFDHSLTREALYADLAVSRRRRLHLRVGRLLAERGPGHARSGDIAWHLRLGGAGEQALPYAIAAGDEAAAVFAYAEAEQHLRGALELAGRAAPLIMERLGAVLAAQARFDEAYAVYEQALVDHRAAADQTGIDRVEAAVAAANFRAGTPEQGIARLTAHLAHPAEDRRRGLAGLELALARLCYADGRYAACRDAAERGARLCRSDDDVALLAGMELWRGIGLLWSDAPDGGVTALNHALTLAERRGLLDIAGTACLPLHLAHALRGDLGRGRQYAERGIAAATRTGDVALLAMHTANRAMTWVYAGDPAAAEPDLAQAVALADEPGDSYFAPLPSAYLGVQRLAAGRLEEAGPPLAAAVVRAREVGNREVLGYARTQLLRLDLGQGRAAAVVEALGPDPDLTDATWWYDVVLLTVLAEALLATDRPTEAARAADRAVARAERMRNRVDAVGALAVRERIGGRLAGQTTPYSRSPASPRPGTM